MLAFVETKWDLLTDLNFHRFCQYLAFRLYLVYLNGCCYFLAKTVTESSSVAQKGHNVNGIVSYLI